jgi:hypothetical protein
MVEAVEKIKNSDIRSKSQATKERCNEGCGKIIACTAAALLAFGALAVCAAPLVAGAALATMATSAGVGSGLIAASAATFVYALSQGEVEVSDLQATTLNNINPEQVAKISNEVEGQIKAKVNTLVENELNTFIQNIDNPELARAT